MKDIKGFPRNAFYNGLKFKISPKCGNFIMVRIHTTFMSDMLYGECIPDIVDYVLENCDVDINSEIYIFVYAELYEFYITNVFKVYDIESDVSYIIDKICELIAGPCCDYNTIATFDNMFKNISPYMVEIVGK
jgi:hypothetical protein